MNQRVSSSTQNQALCAIVLFFKSVFLEDLGDVSGSLRSKRKEKLPIVLSRHEVKALLDNAKGESGLMLKLIYGGGLRKNECMRLRIKDLDFSRGHRGVQLFAVAEELFWPPRSHFTYLFPTSEDNQSNCCLAHPR